VRAFHQPARHCQDECHGHVGCILGQHARCIGDGDAALDRGRDVDIVDAISEVRDQLELIPRLAQYGRIDAIGDRRNQNVGCSHRFGKLALGHGLVVGVEAGIEKFPHSQLDRIGQLARHNDQRLFTFRHRISTAALVRYGRKYRRVRSI
jgi:hypothetical protein